MSDSGVSAHEADSVSGQVVGSTEVMPGGAAPVPRGFQRMWNRSLDRYPERGPRVLYLTIVVVATIVLYYELYVPGAVSTQILQHYGMTFRFYVYTVGVVASAVGAFASLVAGLADRWGRANMVTYGLAITALLILFGVPNAPNKYAFVVLLAAVGFVEGIILVATPALIRDFSPQGGRAAAMGFWTLGPVVGSLVVAEVSSHTLNHLVAWQDQFTICGIVGLGVFVVALFGLKELSPRLRDQVMVSLRDRVLVEARARSIDIGAALRNPWRQMLKLDVIAPAFGAAVMLLVYYALVGFLVIYFATMYGYTAQKANALANWFWAFDAIGLVAIGFISDKLRVRKPFMVFGAVGAAVMTVYFLTRTTHPTTSYYEFVVVLSLMAVFLGIAYAPWFAAFTETIERRNPALAATGLAVSGWVLRAVVTLSSLFLPMVVSSVTPLVNDGAQVASYAKQYPQLVAAGAIDPHTLGQLKAGDLSVAGKAISEISTKLHVSTATATADLLALPKVPVEVQTYMANKAPEVLAAKAQEPTQWQHWWWVCVGGEIAFIPLVFLMAGRWSPRKAKQDAQEHQRRVEEEMAALSGGTGGTEKAEPAVTA